jgi:tetratricopeptide (TPR) repeat protein
MPNASTRIALPDRYRVVRHIANGGMAGVWAAEDELLGRLVAVKVLSTAYAEERAARLRFTREARAGARLSDHPNIVTVFDVGECDGLPYMVMEHFPAGTVAHRLRRDEPIPRPTAVRWLREAASALDHAHRHEVVHRDVKPGNLLLDERGRCAVGDFGIATVASEASVTHTGQVLGTAAYISPEQAVGDPATPASDRYALAVVSWEILTGHRPFQGQTPAAQARAHVEAPVPLASTAAAGLPPAVDEVLERGLSKDPAQRPATARALIDELEAALGDETQPITTPTRRFLRTGSDALAGAGAGLGAAASAAERASAAPAAPRTPRTPPPAAPPPASRRGDDDGPGHGRAPSWSLIAAMAVALLAAAGLALALSGGGNGGGSNAASTTEPPTQKQGRTRERKTPQDRGTSSAPATTPTQTQDTQTQQTQPAPTSLSPVALNDQAYALMQQGNQAGAVPLLQQSVTAFREQGRTGEVTYAYALYNLGRALRLSGRPAEAIPYLQERLRISSDRRSIIERELAAARAATGDSSTAGPGRGGKSGAHGYGHGYAGKTSSFTD